MIFQRENIFAFGIKIFIDQVCGRSQLSYNTAMANRGGYLAACKNFYIESGYQDETRNMVLEENVIPDWMKDVFLNVESRIFGTTFWDKQ